METIIHMNDAEKNIEFEKRRLSKKYDSFGALRKKIINLKCDAPVNQDDFMIWRALRAETRGSDQAHVGDDRATSQVSGHSQENEGSEGVTEAQASELDENTVSKLDEETKIISFIEWLSFETFDIYLALTPKRMEMLDYINTKEPASVKELALGLGRDYKNVYDDVLALSKYNLIDLLKIGRNKTPVTRVDYMQVIPKKY